MGPLGRGCWRHGSYVTTWGRPAGCRRKARVFFKVRRWAGGPVLLARSLAAAAGSLDIGRARKAVVTNVLLG